MPIPLTPVQGWFFEQHRGGRLAHFNQAVLLAIAEPLEPLDDAVLRAALAALLQQHDALRLRFDLAADGTVRQTCAAPGETPVLDTLDLRGVHAWASALEAHADRIQSGLDIAHGPLMRTARFHLDDGDRLLLVVHHLAVDAVSWRILLEDLQTALRQAASVAPVALGPPSWPWGRWARRLAALQAGPDLLAEDAYWIPVEDAECSRLPTLPDAPARRRHGDVRSLPLVLPAADTARLLTRSHRLFETGIMELMLVALGRALAQWCGITATRITLEGHGREPPDAAADVSHTVGWFTSLYPFMLCIAGDNIGAQVTRMKEALAAVPRKGIGHGLLRHGPRPRSVPAAHRPQLAFNYLGRFGDDEGADAAPLLRLTGGPTGRAVDPDLPRAHAIDITALVSEGRLQASIDYDPATLDEAAATRLRDAFAEQLAAVGRHCHERLERLEAQCTAAGGEVVDAYPLAPLQEGMLFQSLLEPGAAIYQVQVRFRFTGPFDLAAFKGAWQDLCRRHAVLSSVFVHEDLPRPMQIVLRGRDPAFHVGTLDSLAAYCADDRQRGFDLHLGPLMRMAVFRERDDLHHVVWTYHHILLDGWCLALLQRDFGELYAARVAARPAQLPPPAPYKDYIRWLGRQDREAARQHWRTHLAGYEQTASLPRRASRDAGAARRLEERLLVLDEATSARLVRTAASLGATLNTMVQTLWALVLARHGDRDEVVFGIVVSGRPAELPGVEQMVGLFIGAVPVRVSLPPDAAFDGVVRQVQASALAAEPHRHLSLADIQAESPLGRALFDHLLIFENYPLAAAGSTPSGTAHGPRLEPVEAHDPTHYDLDLTVVPGARIACRFMFDANVYPPDLIDRVALQLRTVIEAVLDDPTRSIRHLEVLPKEERAWVLEHFNATDRDYPRDTTFIDLFEAQAARTPLAAAVRHGDAAMTYRELDRAASRLAGHLRRLGVGAEAAVGVCVDRCADMIVAPLAVLKAGGVFVPLDPDYPRQRLAFMVADAGIRVLVTRSLLADRLDGLGEDTCIVRMDAVEPLADTSPAPRPAPSDTAYLIYTSGSTGQPKGVRVSHANLASAVFAWRHAYHLDDLPVRLLQMASCSFDVFMGDLVRALAHGGSLVVCPHDALPDPAALHALLLRHEITLFEATPAVVLPLMDHVHRHGLSLPALRLLIVGSDLLPAAHFRALWNRFGKWLRVVNSYGASEATIDTSFFEMSDPAALEAAGPHTPIGRPLPNTRCYVLDRLGRPQPMGAPGELYIGGAGVAQGYLNRPDLTEARFLACDAAGGARVYRTGDVARWLPDGNLDFMGRRDAQVKVRGYRIELGEIEDRLLRCPSVAQAVVLARDAGQGPELVAYVVAAAGWDVGATRSLLRETLPGYMVPAFFVRLDSLPLSPNGKVDRRALPDPRATAERTKAYEPPEGEVELSIATVWQRVLQLPQVGRHDDFFELGGHSLKALQITAQVHQALGVSVPLRRFFEEPTVAALACQVHATEAHARTSLADIVPAPALPHHALSHAQRRLWMLDQLGGGAAYNMPEAHLIHADVDARALGAALGALIARHESLRTAFIVADGEPRQQVRAEAPLTLAEHDLRDEPPAVAQARARELADRDAHQPFNLGEPPLVRASLARMPDGRCLFVLTLHHIVGDGWSCNLLMRELLALYDALRRGLPDPLPPLRIQYKDFAHWQNAQGFDTQERYWLVQLAGLPAQVSLPYDFAAEEARSFTGGHTQLTLERHVADGLRRLARERRTTLANVMLALLQLLLFHWTRQGDLCVGMSVANRSHPDVERLIGFFVNLLPIRCRLDDEMEFDDLLAQVIERTGEALEHQDYPFDRMVEKLNPERRANRQPLVNVVYGFQNFLDVHTGDAPPGPAEAGPVGWSSFDISFAKSKFDLTLFVVEEQDDIVLTLEYDSSLFLDTTLRTQLNHFAGFAAALAGATPSPGSTQ